MSQGEEKLFHGIDPHDFFAWRNRRAHMIFTCHMDQERCIELINREECRNCFKNRQDKNEGGRR